MNRGHHGILAAAAALLLAGMTVHAAQPPTQCTTRDCLIKLADDYLAALVAHDSTRLPFSADARFVENVQRKQLGEGLWQSASNGKLHEIEAMGLRADYLSASGW